MDADDIYRVGDRVFFWTGRGSVGWGTIRKLKYGRAVIDPDDDAHKGSDYRILGSGAERRERWRPRDFGVSLDHLNTPPNPWVQNN